MSDFPKTAPRLTTNDPHPRRNTTARGYGHRWQQVRRLKLQQSPLCELAYDGCTGFASQVHHADENTSNNTPGNLKSCCFPCHLKHHRHG